ncbi:hypothetical protein D3C81_1924750 [compost metagenome]
MSLKLIAQPTQDNDGLFDGGLGYQHRLKTSFKRCVFFDVLLILIECRRTDQTKLPARQCGFQYVGNIQAALLTTLPRANDRVQLVNEQNKLRAFCGDFIK